MNRKKVYACVGICMILLSVISVFKVNIKKEGDTTELSEAEIKIETIYGIFYYPEKWEPYTTIKKLKNDEKIQFWCDFEEKKQTLLFEVTFNGDGDQIGLIKANDQIIEVGVKVQDIEKETNWTEEQKEIVSQMLEDINYLLTKMKRIDGFEFIN